MKCPICKHESALQYRPFCSRRCADVDLGRWFGGDYAMPAEEPPEDAEEQIIEAAGRRGRH